MFHSGTDTLTNKVVKSSYPSWAYNQVERSDFGAQQEKPTFTSWGLKSGARPGR